MILELFLTKQAEETLEVEVDCRRNSTITSFCTIDSKRVEEEMPS